ncbi:hypothetical protein [Sphingobacterium haloxyli]|uniref:Outer membrane protein beta-barrel domain-containing protein n=1 Tax=Sphingobacterium haloxyli TaxID=2100533 RepID=A0A2S9J875_9SPHI|nr:hypothetical protein [Sphingobacterium haloxyli]PRD48974.1 hypothetical protein C5745_03280 [Sphingobacterium haloxyli]
MTKISNIVQTGLLTLATAFTAQAQDKKISAKAFEGIVVAGYVDGGAYLNCTGPSVKYTEQKWNLTLGFLPALKIKKDSAPVKNSTLTPTLALGATLTLFKHFAIQIPTFYTPKTSTQNGRWTLGAGLGYKI